jgi:sphinganine-1-phosphate aldolase
MKSLKSLEENLQEIDRLDVDSYSGKLFTYVYETGDTNLREIAHRALNMFYDKNALDFTVFKSAVYFEREIVNFAKHLSHADENVLGTLTYGGTESVLLAVKSARDYFRKLKGKDVIPELILPISAHPSWEKAAEYFDLKVQKIPLDKVNKKADLESLKEVISNKSAIIVGSAPNFPYGSIDPIREMSEITEEKGILFHVDACVGGFILPFFEELGEKVPIYDYRVNGVTSISMDVHKYGYAPKGSSVLLFKNSDLKKYSEYINISWPSYIFVNTAILSSRSVGPMASGWAVINYLGNEGYIRLAKKVLSARKFIYEEMHKLGFKPTAPIESSILSLFNENIDLFNFVINMQKRSWNIPVQRGIPGLVANNIHMTLTPIHDIISKNFVADAKEVINQPVEREPAELMEDITKGNIENLSKMLREGTIDTVLIEKLLELIPADTAIEIAHNLVNEMFK